ncbi:MAG TPA: YaeQ family protein, partial [Gammaproteobacteria bacterium]|nr:YaeQ family protein [Gammaproteobacteria bacterium]
MALTATIYTFDVELAHADRGVYESLAVRAARHPSESEDYLVTRVLAYCLEHTEGIAFATGGLSEPDEPALAVRDLTGRITSWIEIGAPDAARVHRASKAAQRVAVYTHKDPDKLLAQWAGERIHRAADVELYALDRTLVASLAARLQRRMAFALSVTGGQLYVTLGETVLEGAVQRRELQ